MFYTARDGDNFLKLQLHRVGLDGKGERRLTDPAFHHTVGSCMTGAAARGAGGAFGGGAGVRHLAGQQATSSTSTRRTTSPPATQVVDAASGTAVVRLAAKRSDEVHRAWAEEGRDVHLHGGRRHDDPARHDSISVGLRSVAQVSRRSSACMAGRRRRAIPRAKRSSRRARSPNMDSC